jgi:glycosyltransferase involved in cell wall biosynthesis
VEQIRFQSPGWRQKLNYIYFHFWCLWKVFRWKPDWIYCSDAHSTPPGWLLAVAGKRVLYHEHDTPQPANGRAFERLLLWARTNCSRRARVCVIPNARRAESLGDAIVVWNCPRLEETAGPREAMEPGQLRLLYHGSIVPERLPMSVIGALAAVRGGVSLTVAGYETAGSRGYMKRLRDRANKLGISGRLRFVGAVTPRNKLLALCREHDAGLALMPLDSADVNLRHMEGASNKPFDYLACGLALIVSRLPEWERVFVAPGYGYSCHPASASELARIFEDLLENPARTRAMGEAGRRRILGEWNYESQFRPVLNVLESRGEREDASCAAEAGC